MFKIKLLSGNIHVKMVDRKIGVNRPMGEFKNIKDADEIIKSVRGWYK